MLDKIRAAITALNHGEKLLHSATWKQRQNLLNGLLAFLGAVVVFLPEYVHVSQEDIAAIAGGVAAVAGLLNNYLTTATSARVGLPPVSGNSDGENAA